MNVKLEYTYNQSNIMRESFQVPSNFKNMKITYTTSVEIKNYCLMLAIEDENSCTRLKKLLSQGEEMVISEKGEESTVGAVTGILGAGTWHATIYIFPEYLRYNPVEGGFDVTLHIEQADEVKAVADKVDVWSSIAKKINTVHYDWDKVYSTEKKWYKGDFHTHTHLSDGRETVVSVTEKAKTMAMDFYVPTEHNLLHTGWVDTDMCILPGTEITNQLGHFNIFGIKEETDFIDEIMSTTDEEYVNKIIDTAYANGEIISINHPFLTRWKWLFENTDLSKIHTIEVINDPTYTDAKASNDMAVMFMDTLWNDGHRIYAVGGSDSHNLINDYYAGSDLPSIAGDPGTFVYMDKLTPNSLLESVKRGHMYITRFCNLDVNIYSNDTTYLPGDEVSSSVTYEITVHDTDEEMDIFLVENGEFTKLNVEKTEKIQKVKVFVEFGSEYKWARIEVRNKDFEFRGYTNPIYKGSKETTFKTFSQAKKFMEGKND